MLGGIAAFVVMSVLQKLGLNPVEDFMNETVIDLVEKYIPDAADQVREEIERQNLEGPGAAALVIGIISTLFFNTVGGLIGGAIGASIFKRAPVALTSGE